MELFEERLAESQLKLESADKEGFRYEQGRLFELRVSLELEQTAEAVIEAERALKKRPPSID
jgi:hypothetical protein